MDAQELLVHEASMGAIGTSLPSRLDPLLHGVDVPRAALSSSELLEVGDSLKKLGNMSGQNVPQRFNNLGIPNPSGGPFPLLSGQMETIDMDPADNANLLGNIMAWFHDMNPQNISLVPPAAPLDLEPNTGAPEEPVEDPFQQWPLEADREVSEFHNPEDREPVRPTQLDLVSVDMPSVAPPVTQTSENPEPSLPRHSENPKCDSDPDQPSSSSSEWEGQVHLV